MKATPPSYWDPAWNMQAIRRGDSEVVPLLVPEKEDINVGGIPEFDVEPFTITVIKFVNKKLCSCATKKERRVAYSFPAWRLTRKKRCGTARRWLRRPRWLQEWPKRHPTRKNKS